jgi:hypothetical protein
MARRNSAQQQYQRTPRAPIVVNVDPASRPSFAPKQYGKPFIVMENAAKQTFHFAGGAWVPYDRSIADCRLDCDVKQLAQKVNNMTRYEVRPPLE